MNQLVFVLTGTLLCALFIFNDSAILRPVELAKDNQAQALNTSSDDQSYDFIYPHGPIMGNESSLPPNISANMNSTGNDTIEEEDRIAINAVRSIVG